MTLARQLRRAYREGLAAPEQVRRPLHSAIEKASLFLYHKIQHLLLKRKEMASINSLSFELLEQILNYVVGDSATVKGHLSSTSEIFDTRPFPQYLLLVNKAFYAVAQRLHNQHIRLTIRSERGDKDTQRTLQLIQFALNGSLNADFLNNIRHLTITCEERKTPWQASSHPQPLEHALYPRYIEQLAAIIPKLSNLKSVTFRSEHNISMQLLRALENHHPQCHLHIRDYRNTPGSHSTNPTEISLENSPNLRSITVQLKSGWGQKLECNVGVWSTAHSIEVSTS